MVWHRLLQHGLGLIGLGFLHSFDGPRATDQCDLSRCRGPNWPLCSHLAMKEVSVWQLQLTNHIQSLYSLLKFIEIPLRMIRKYRSYCMGGCICMFHLWHWSTYSACAHAGGSTQAAKLLKAASGSFWTREQVAPGLVTRTPFTHPLPYFRDFQGRPTLSC